MITCNIIVFIGMITCNIIVFIGVITCNIIVFIGPCFKGAVSEFAKFPSLI